jgi:hypothetical protein
MAILDTTYYTNNSKNNEYTVHTHTHTHLYIESNVEGKICCYAISYIWHNILQ